MNLRISGLIATFALAGLLGSGQSLAQNAYITNGRSNTVSVINTKTNKVTATIPGVDAPIGVAATDGKVYVTNLGNNTVSVIDTATNMVTATIPVDGGPVGVAVTPDGSKVYVANEGGSVNLPPPPATVSVIDTATNTVTDTITIGPNADVPGVR